MKTKTVTCACECGCGRSFTWEMQFIKAEGGVCWWCQRGIHLGKALKKKKERKRT